MATTPRSRVHREVEYPTSDGKPMAETDIHRDDMLDVIETLKSHFAGDPRVYVSGNLLLFYEEGDKHKHVSPDVFVVRGVPKLPPRKYYLLWQEGRVPDVVIELTSKSTRSEDQRKKFLLYRDVLQVPEYFLFDPFEEYLKPSMRGYRLADEQYWPIEPVEGRYPSEALGLHLERDGVELRLFDPATGRRLPTPREQAAEGVAALAEARRAQLAQQAAETELERLRQEIEGLRRRLGESP